MGSRKNKAQKENAAKKKAFKKQQNWEATHKIYRPMGNMELPDDSILPIKGDIVLDSSFIPFEQGELASAVACDPEEDSSLVILPMPSLI